MEEILDRETKIEKQNTWITIIVSNISTLFHKVCKFKNELLVNLPQYF